MASSFPKRALFHRVVGTIALMLIVASMSILATKRCTQAVVSDSIQFRKLQNSGQSQVVQFVSRYFYQLHVLHVISLLAGGLLLVALSLVNLVPDNDHDIKFAFHFVSVFVVFSTSLVTLYASFIAYERPCLTPVDRPDQCCSIVSSPGLLSSSERPSITALSAKDSAMVAVMVLDLLAGLILLTSSAVYFRDVRQEADRVGYLHRVHNEGYIVRLAF